MQHDKWLQEALDQIPHDLVDCTGEKHRDILAEYLSSQVKRCRAKSKSRFWIWLRLALAKTEDTSKYLMWVRESRCPLEVKSLKGGFQFTVNGDVALISVGDADHPAVWRVPLNHLEWGVVTISSESQTIARNGIARGTRDQATEKEDQDQDARF